MRLKDSLVVFLLLSVSKTLCFVNLAHTPGKHLQGNASWNVIAHQDDWEADKAVDGNTNQTYQPTCAIAQYANGYKSVWWKVWLQRIFNVAYLELYFRFGIADRLTGFSIYVYNDISFVPPSGNKGTFVYHHDPMSGCPRSLQSITVNKVAQGVAFFNDRPDGYLSNCGDLTRTSIEICEVRVMGKMHFLHPLSSILYPTGCEQDRYGSGCGGTCSSKCKDRHCDVFNGSCIYGCSDPSVGSPSCSECVDGCYDKNCSTKCGNCLQGICHKKNGTCRSSCLQNWREPLCQECIDGHYGKNCSEKCGNCLQGICDKKNGVCKNGCLQNWQGPLCQVCERYKYGPNCVFNCGHCKGSEPCNTGNGTCVNGCEPDWEGAFCVKGR
ncbi:protein draper-like [Saccostrea cucullata]|uniref:protein draper-like n=1 Tax=Saccostrea cuccullata TaxID=36930 RepID=UPI002ED35601